ncbi:MAG: cytochrome c biogenesis protein CcdA, partial [Planctomycetota bacterium]
MTTRPALLFVLLVSLLPAAFLHAQEEQAPAAPPPVAVGLTLDEHEVAPGAEIAGVLTLVHAEGYSTWPADAGLIPEDFALVTPLSVALSDDSAAFAEILSVGFPDPVALTTTDSFIGDTYEVVGYTGQTDIPIALRITGETDAADITLSIELQTFTAESEGEFESVTVTAALTNPNAPTDEPVSAAASAEFLGITMPDFSAGVAGALLLFAFSILGGFLLNLTPCVLPVIPLKVMTLTQHAGESKGRALFLGGTMTFGVVFFWAALGAPLAILVAVGRDFVDPSALIFGRWWITLGIGAIIALMGLGIMGLFSISLPQKAYMVNPSADNASGSFLFGVMAAVLGLPCFGFVVAPLLAGASQMPPLNIMLVFVGLGIGMGAPYLVFSLYPGLLSFMPKAGPASELIKQIMGLLLIAGAIFFIVAGLNTLFKAEPYLKGQVRNWLIVLTLVATGLWLAYQTIKITTSAAKRGVFVTLGLAIVGVSTLFAYDAGVKAKKKYDREVAGLAK